MINNYTKAKGSSAASEKEIWTHIMLPDHDFSFEICLSIKILRLLFQPIFALPTKEDAGNRPKNLCWIYLSWKATLTYIQNFCRRYYWWCQHFSAEICAANYDEEMKNQYWRILLLYIQTNAEKHLAEKVLVIFLLKVKQNSFWLLSILNHFPNSSNLFQIIHYPGNIDSPHWLRIERQLPW